MVARKRRVRIVLDTNVLVRNFLTRSRTSPNRIIFRLWWWEKKLQLIVSPETSDEYLEIFSKVAHLSAADLAEWREIFAIDARCTLVNLARRYTESRDPDDNVFLATAAAGEAQYLITNDRDLLDLSGDFRKALPFEIQTPREFLQDWPTT